MYGNHKTCFLSPTSNSNFVGMVGMTAKIIMAMREAQVGEEQFAPKRRLECSHTVFF